MNIQEKTEENKTYRKIYVACLSSYNSGVLHGEWITLLDDQLIWDTNIEDYIQKEIDKMLKSSKMPFAEEWAIDDYDDFSNLGEYPSIEEISNYAYAIERHVYEVVKEFKEMYPSEDISSLDDRTYHTDYAKFQDYADNYADEVVLSEYDSNSTISNYFDYEKFAHDLKHDYSVYETDDHDVIIFEDF